MDSLTFKPSAVKSKVVTGAFQAAIRVSGSRARDARLVLPKLYHMRHLALAAAKAQIEANRDEAIAAWFEAWHDPL